MEAQKILGYGTEVIFLINTNTGGCMKYQYINVQDLEKLNKAAKKKDKNQYLADDTVEYLKHHYKAVLVKFYFLHNEVENRLVLYGGDKYETLLLDVDFKDMKYVKTGYTNEQKEAA